jgi:Plasmid encoded RepA protein
MSYEIIHWTPVTILIEFTNIFPNSSPSQKSRWTAEAAWCRVAVDLKPATEERRVQKVAAVHKLIEELGKQGALRAAETEGDRRAVEAAISYMSDEEAGIGFLYSGWCQAALPHKKLADDAIWKVQTERVTLVVEPGRRNLLGDDMQFVGVPYGSRARLILLYLQSEALRTSSRDIELGRSLHAWLGRLGIPIGGKSFKDVREQADRLSRCRLTFHVQQGGRAGLINQNIVDAAMFVAGDDGQQESLFVETARLSETFYEQLKKHPVPLEEPAIKAISNNSQALDVYCWLAYRLHVLPAARTITWPSLFAQFGSSYKKLAHFKTRHLDSRTGARCLGNA